ncbi:MAG: hotdog fold thioesterase [Prolixibacteraceae bacterium]|jgi:1,4-dihydroxy-2-naphthoyl-CoA hydrolase|nr:hotdog fold thioesterase [Prolixibacteraceae bacterium]
MNISEINQFCQNSMVSHLGIEFLECTETMVVASMPVNSNTHQPLGYLHGGASLALAETVGSAGSLFNLDTEKYLAFGMSVTGNHVASIQEGKVIATATIVHKGRTSHVWDVEIKDEAGKLISVARVTNAIVEKK